MGFEGDRWWHVAPRVAQELHGASDPLRTMEKGVALAVELVPGCDAATVTTLVRSTFSTTVATTDRAREVDELQYGLAEGPCHDAALTGVIVESPDVTRDERWQSWGPRAGRLGVGAVISLPLTAVDRGYGALNLYADRVAAHDAEGRAVATALASQLGVAVAAAAEIRQRAVGMTSRTVIGQAEGILMERYGISADDAFGLLVRLSQDSNTKLRQIAEDLITTRALPGSVRSVIEQSSTTMVRRASARAELTDR